MTTRTLLGAVALAVAATSLGLGCSAGYTSPAEKLDKAVFRYNDAVRWRNYQTASSYVNAAERKRYLAVRRAIADEMTVLDYEIKSVRHDTTAKKAEVVVRFTWHELPSNIVQHTAFKQQWRYTDRRTWEFVSQEKVKATPRTAKRTAIEDRF